MRRPEQPATMAYPMVPVVRAIVGEKDEQPSPPLVPDAEECKAVEHGEEGELRSFRQDIDEKIANTHRETGGCVLDFIKITTHDRICDYLQSHKEQEGWYRKVNQVWHVFLPRRNTSGAI